VSDYAKSDRRVAQRAAVIDWHYTHACQFKRARRQLKLLHRSSATFRRKIEGNPGLEGRLGRLLDLA
jgi:transposase, IS5 family